MNDGPPDFIIAGAPRCGTTWLYHLLDRHPGVYMAKPARPEPKFFLVDSEYRRGMGYYVERWFAEVPRGVKAGEKSTNYLEGPNVADRIHNHLPNVKLIFILREPAERAYSNYVWSRMNGLESEEFERALEMEDVRSRSVPEDLRHSPPHAYFARGLYADLLKPYFDRFDRRRISCLKFEDIVGCPRDLADRLHRFLGVESRPADAEGIGVINPSEKSGAAVPPACLVGLRERYKEANDRLADLLGDSFSSWSPS